MSTSVKQKTTKALGFPVVFWDYMLSGRNQEGHPAQKNPVVVPWLSISMREHRLTWVYLENVRKNSMCMYMV